MEETIISFDVGIKNLAYMVLKISSDGARIHSWDILPLVKDDENANKVGVDTLSVRLFNELETMWNALPSHHVHVIIENQPALKNPVMKTIQVLIYGFYTYKRTFMASESTSVKCIRLMSATSKLKLGKIVDVQLEKEPSSKYKKNKLLGIAYATAFLPQCLNHAEHTTHFESHKKKDDLADAFLQTVVYVRENGWMTFVNANNNNAERVS